jgi:hypothetical protein
MEQEKMVKCLFFFDEMKNKAMKEIRETGTLHAAIFALTEKEDNGKKCVAAAMIPNFMGKNGIELLTSVIRLTIGLRMFVDKVEEQEETKVIAVFHCELLDDENGQKLYTMRKFCDNGNDSDDNIKVYNLVHGDSTVDENGNIVAPELEFVEDEE